MFNLNTEIMKIQGIPKRFMGTLEKLRIKTVRDLLWHFPSRYDDFSHIVKIAHLKIGQSATIRGTVKKVLTRKSWKKKMPITEALVVDDTGGIRIVWFNQPYIAQNIRAGQTVNFAGRVLDSESGAYLSSPVYEIYQGLRETKHTAGIIPVYPETKGLTSKGLRYLIKPFLKNVGLIEDFVPTPILTENGLPDLTTALRNIHFPNSSFSAERARKRFAFDDLLLLQLNNLKIRSLLAKEKAPVLKMPQEKLDTIITELPFELTHSQKRSLEEIVGDLGKPMPMNRLIQGDVGSGKTVVAALAAIIATYNKKQAAFMAPTEVLARQHYRTMIGLFKNIPNIGIGLLIGAEARVFYGEGLETKTEKKKLLEDIESGKMQFVIGTHALIASKEPPLEGKKKKKTILEQKSIMFFDLGLAIVDEQHRFGVDQRAALVKQEKKPGDETTIHFLSMSATPIPRTLSLTLFGDLDLSIIDELPKGRKPIITKLVDPINRDKAYAFIKEQIKKGRQAFVICPRIETENGDEVLSDRAKAWSEVKTVKAEYERLSKKVFPDLRVAIIHGKLKSKEKEKIMTDFASGAIDVLVSTSVIEVGVDMPNASIMMIEGADRFGLAQLYQFRGRVGRGAHQSFCLLFTDSQSDTTRERLEALLAAKNGFELAEKDLAIRGPGQFLGDKQTGIPDIAMRALNNIELVKKARDAAEKILAEDSEFGKYPLLKVKLKEFEGRIHLE